MNRKLIRPSLTDMKSREREVSSDRERSSSGGSSNNGGLQMSSAPRRNVPIQNSPTMPAQQQRSVPPTSDGAGAIPGSTNKSKKVPPPMETNAELFYYKKQIDTHTLMIIVLQDGEEIEGTIEWYDRHALKINRTSAPNIMLLKHNIKYMFKAEDREASAGD